MKIFYSFDEITDNCCNPCPILNKDKNIIGIHIGSCKCKECKYCYGASNKHYPDLIGVGDKNGNLSLRRNYWIKCSGIRTKIPIHIKIQKLLYDLKRKIIGVFN